MTHSENVEEEQPTKKRRKVVLGEVIDIDSEEMKEIIAGKSEFKRQVIKSSYSGWLPHMTIVTARPIFWAIKLFKFRVKRKIVNRKIVSSLTVYDLTY